MDPRVMCCVLRNCEDYLTSRRSNDFQLDPSYGVLHGASLMPNNFKLTAEKFYKYGDNLRT